MTDFTGKAVCTCGKEMNGGGGSHGGVLSVTWRHCECGVKAMFYSVREGYKLVAGAERLDEREYKEKERQDLLDCFKNANMEVLRSWNIENGYSGTNADWLLVQTPLGLITIGWRKRVINIDWTDTGIKHLIEGDATKWEEGCHAWGYDKAVEALISLGRS